MPLVYKLSEMIEEAYRSDEFTVFIIYGPLGYGKSSYACQVLAELYGDQDASPLDPAHWNWEAAKRHIFFHPRGFLEYVSRLDRREKAIVWDDAGVWLYALDWNDPFIKAVGRYLQTARTDFGGMVFTAPNPLSVIRKLREIPAAITVKIIKEQSDYEREAPGGRIEVVKPRIARMFRTWMTPDTKRWGVVEFARDQFNAILPDHFYEWYKPYRDSYKRMAVKLMMRHITSLLKETEDIEELEEEARAGRLHGKKRVDLDVAKDILRDPATADLLKKLDVDVDAGAK